jgi:hypothetical protein
MKYLLLFWFPLFAFAAPVTRTLKSGSAHYKVSYLTKTVEADSKEVKGKMICESECEFLLAIPVKSFDSGDSNRDLNMMNTVEAATYPVVTAKGKFKKELWGQKEFTIEALVNFHGVEATYPVTVLDQGKKASFKVDLDRHKIERPSLFTVKIDKEVPLDFNLDWSE